MIFENKQYEVQNGFCIGYLIATKIENIRLKTTPIKNPFNSNLRVSKTRIGATILFWSLLNDELLYLETDSPKMFTTLAKAQTYLIISIIVQLFKNIII